MNITNLASTLNLEFPEIGRIEQCISRYSTDISLFNLRDLFYKIRNAICHLWGNSDWQQAQKMLQERIIVFFQKGFFSESEKDLIPEKAQILSDFVLRHLTTKKAIESNHHQYLIEWEQYSHLSLNEIFGRVIFGKQKDLPTLNREEVMRRVKMKFRAYEGISSSSENVINTVEDIFDFVNRSLEQSEHFSEEAAVENSKNEEQTQSKGLDANVLESEKTENQERTPIQEEGNQNPQNDVLTDSNPRLSDERVKVEENRGEATPAKENPKIAKKKKKKSSATNVNKTDASNNNNVPFTSTEKRLCFFLKLKCNKLLCQKLYVITETDIYDLHSDFLKLNRIQISALDLCNTFISVWNKCQKKFPLANDELNSIEQLKKELLQEQIDSGVFNKISKKEIGVVKAAINSNFYFFSLKQVTYFSEIGEAYRKEQKAKK